MRVRQSAVLIPALTLGVCGLGLVLAGPADGRRVAFDPTAGDAMIMEEPMPQGLQGGFGMVGPAQFRTLDLPLGDPSPPTTTPHRGSHGGTIIAEPGGGALVLDRELGELVRIDDAGAVVAQLDVQPGAGELVRDGASAFAYVADRRGDRVIRVAADSLQRVDGVAIHEPHGLALSPDGATLYVTSVANRELVALDTQTMHPRWRLALAAEPRGVAVSADGREALVGFLTTGVLARVELDGAEPNLDYTSLDPAALANPGDPFGMGIAGPMQANVTPPPSADALPSPADSKDLGRQFARNTFAVAYIGDDLAIAPHQLSTPHLPSPGLEDTGTYGGGGGFLAPIIHRMAMLDSEPGSFAPAMAMVEIGVHQPRALAYDAARDTLYLAGYGNDQVMAIAEVSQASMHLASTGVVPGIGGACGPDGLSVAGDTLYVHCELTRSVAVADLASTSGAQVIGFHQLGELGPSARSPAAQRGAELFRRGRDGRISVGGFMACASCHPEGRTDGLSWRIEGHNLQTPLLAGRVSGTHPFKWDGQDKDLPTSLTNTVGRLGGAGLTPGDVADLQAFLESLPEPVAPTPADADAIARGRALFASDETGCANCHDGPKLTDGSQYALTTNIGKVDTPSLIGLAHTAPYYHDGSAQTLRALLTDRGSVHDMGQTAHLDDAQLDDLIAYLESL